jgi:metal-responsive CopG/Arc/MetJ family transcriptional regulator
MSTTKIAITIDEGTLKRLDQLVSEKKFPNRSRAIQEAVEKEPAGQRVRQAGPRI